MYSRVARFRSVLSIPFFLVVAGAAPAQEGAVAFRGAAIETAGKTGRIENGTLVIRKGKIEAVGPDVKIPDDARLIEARGLTLMPGVIEPFREVSIAGASADTEPRTIVIGGRVILLGGGPGVTSTGFTRIADNFYPYEPGYRTLLRSGLTGMNLVASGYGQAAFIRLTPDQPDGMLQNADGSLFTSVTNSSSSLDIIRTALETVEKVRKGGSLPEATEPATPAADATPPRVPRKGGPRPMPKGKGGTRTGGPVGPAPSMNPTTLKLWDQVYDGKTPLFVNAASSAAIVHLLKAIEPYKNVKLVLAAQPASFYETLDRLIGKPVRLLIRPGLSLKPNTRDRVDVARMLHDAGLDFAFTHPPGQSELQVSQDFPLFSVAYLVKCGLPRQVALEALTARPAAMLGLEQTLGTLEPGKSANLLIFNGDPLDLGGQLSQVLIEGRTVHEN